MVVWRVTSRPQRRHGTGLRYPLFDRFTYGGPTADGAAWQEGAALLLEDAVTLMQDRAARCRGVVRLHTPTGAEPLVVVVDEVAALTAYVTDNAIKKRLASALSLLLSQGRAVGVTVVAATQDARKEVLGIRDLFPTRVALRSAEPEQADIVLGAGARNRGAHTDQISDRTPGVGYVALEGLSEPVRVRVRLRHRRPHCRCGHRVRAAPAARRPLGCVQDVPA